ncbi:MAG: leucine-rich repeat protein [Ruminococcus sp.]|nr:leucine-rich repeat protein [Ruminococcus sp.]
MERKRHIVSCALGLCIAFGAMGCGKRVLEEKDFCHLVLEEGEGFFVEESALTVERGKDASFEMILEDGYELQNVKYGDDREAGSAARNYSVKYDGDGRALTLTLYDVRYSETVQARVEKSDVVIRYHANGKQDGSGTQIGLGSRVDTQEGMLLYAQWVPWTDAALFEYEDQGEFARITDYQGQEDTICIPAELDGKKVRRIAEGAFAGVDCRRVILPPGIYEVENKAFESASLQELYLYDDISKISDHAFAGCGQFETLHINAIEPPVYSGNYFDTFQDKYDRLLQLKDQKKIVLFSGSSTRFGYDSTMIDEAFEEYEVVNMGVFAYTPALPQLQLILECMQEGDILLHAPEFDASNRQFCGQKALDYATFAMMESGYDVFTKLDIRDFEQVFTAFSSYNAGREGMEKKNYKISASHYDEDGIPVEEDSYNEYGDYCLYRPNSAEEQPIYGLPVHYTVNAFPKGQYIEPLNAVYEQFLEKGADVYFTYSPRNQYAVSEESTPEERARLHQYFQENLIVPVITELEDSLVSGVYLYGTDNHLSTEGVEIRTRRIIQELKEEMEKEQDEK